MKKDQTENQKLVAIREAAEFLNVSIDTVRRYDKLGILHSTRPGGKIRYFNTEELKKVKSSKYSTIAVSTGTQKTNSLKKVSLLFIKILLLLLTIFTVLFLLFPEQTARFFTSFM